MNAGIIDKFTLFTSSKQNQSTTEYKINKSVKRFTRQMVHVSPARFRRCFPKRPSCIPLTSSINSLSITIPRLIYYSKGRSYRLLMSASCIFSLPLSCLSSNLSSCLISYLHKKKLLKAFFFKFSNCVSFPVVST